MGLLDSGVMKELDGTFLMAVPAEELVEPSTATSWEEGRSPS
jgi:hypothetical protein